MTSSVIMKYMSRKEKSIPEVVKKVLPAVVSITISKYLTVFEHYLPPFPGFNNPFAIPRGRKKVKIGGGSGFIVDPAGLILTNRHVVADPKAEYVVILDDKKKFKTKILATNPINDLAILKIEAKNLPIIELGDSSRLELGQTVIAIGNTLGAFQNTVSAGVISGLSREIVGGNFLDGKRIRMKKLIQTDAAINPGNSGGPLINLEGKVIGINTAVVFLAENVGFAIPINPAKKDLEDVKNYGKIKIPFLGIRYILINKKLKEKYDLPVDHGALLVPMGLEKAVLPGGPAEKAGLKEGDIILEVNQEKISLRNPLEEVLQKFQVGEEIELKIIRSKKLIKLKANLGEKK